MKGDAQPLIKFFDGSDKRFIIPLYQRNYDWKEENCEQLFQDLMKLHNSDRRSHFFGSIVSSIQPGTEDRFIIDGQQRITTVSLLLIAMVNAKKEGLIEATDAKLVEKIFKRYLVDEYQEDERKVKLKPIKKDMQAFDALLYKPKEQCIKESNVTRNYDFFYDKITRAGLTLDELFETIKKLEVINIRLDEDDDPQLIFESLNSTGLDLSEADKIRNYLLMSLAPVEQDDLYTRYWNPIEEFTKYDPSSFVRDYLTMKQGKIGRIDKIYFIFKEYAEDISVDRATLLEDMHHYATIYYQVDSATIGTDKLNRKLNQLRTLDSTIAYPFFMAFFDYASKVGLAENEIYRVLDVIEADRFGIETVLHAADPVASHLLIGNGLLCRDLLFLCLPRGGAFLSRTLSPAFSRIASRFGGRAGACALACSLPFLCEPGFVLCLLCFLFCSFTGFLFLLFCPLFCFFFIQLCLDPGLFLRLLSGSFPAFLLQCLLPLADRFRLLLELFFLFLFPAGQWTFINIRIGMIRRIFIPVSHVSFLLFVMLYGALQPHFSGSGPLPSIRPDSCCPYSVHSSRSPEQPSLSGTCSPSSSYGFSQPQEGSQVFHTGYRFHRRGSAAS